MRDDLRIGFGDELMALSLQLLFQIEIVLDDAVVDDDDLARAVAMGVGVLFGRPAVRRPPSMADAIVAGQRRQPDDRFKVGELASAPPKVHTAVAHDGHARRVVAAVLEPPQPVDENRHNVFGPDISDDSAHNR